jgi:hypothetical protein
MKPLKERLAQREHHKKVYRGEVDDPKVLYGADAPEANQDTTTNAGGGDNGGGESPNKYANLRSHDDLNGPNGLGDREKPEGWDDMKVADKQKWLADNETAPTGWSA